MERNRLLFVDTETGGTDPQKHGILAVGLVVWENRQIGSSKEILINDRSRIISKEAISINRINLAEHIREAKNLTSATSEVIEFLKENFDIDEKITLAGHNISFDIAFLKALFSRSKVRYATYFSHRSIDTASILHFLYLSGRLKNYVVSSDSAFQEFCIDVDRRHTALGDALATAALFNKLLEIEQGVELQHERR